MSAEDSPKTKALHELTPKLLEVIFDDFTRRGLNVHDSLEVLGGAVANIIYNIVDHNVASPETSLVEDLEEAEEIFEAGYEMVRHQIHVELDFEDGDDGPSDMEH